MTEILNQRAKKVVAVEYDNRFVRKLEEKTAYSSNTTIIYHDRLNVYLPKEEFIVMSTISYSITTPIM